MGTKASCASNDSSSDHKEAAERIEDKLCPGLVKELGGRSGLGPTWDGQILPVMDHSRPCGQNKHHLPVIGDRNRQHAALNSESEKDEEEHKGCSAG
jgi:hypothetical protein